MNRTVLVVDDDEPLRASLCESLVDEGYFAVGCPNGLEALGYLHATAAPPCLILLDLMMPVMNGWEFLEEQRRDPALASIPLLVFTANGTVGLDAIDAADFLAKPLTLDRLLERVEHYCTC
jgi:CheY-like chemotaxis protein